MNFEELIGLSYGSKTLLRSDVKFMDSNGRVVMGNVFSGVRGEKIGRSLFSVSLSGRFDFDLVKVSPAIKFGTKSYNKGALVTTDNGANLFIPMDTLKIIQKKASKVKSNNPTLKKYKSKKEAIYDLHINKGGDYDEVIDYVNANWS